MSHLLWRDVCAMAKSLRRQLSQTNLGHLTTPQACIPLVDALGQASALACAAPSTPGLHPRASQALPPMATLETGDTPAQGLLLGTHRSGDLLSKTRSVFLSDDGLLRQAMVNGCAGSGRTATLLTMALNAAASGKGVFYLDAHGDNGLYARALSGLSSLQQLGHVDGNADIAVGARRHGLIDRKHQAARHLNGF